MSITLVLRKADGTAVDLQVALDASKLLLQGRTLTDFSDNVALLTRLTSLNASGNAISTIPVGVFLVQSLTALFLDQNEMFILCEKIGRLTRLRELYLQKNNLMDVPHTISQLQRLEFLVLSDNFLRALPSQLGRLTTLRHLDLSGNQLKWLPLSLDRLPMTTSVLLSNNPLPISNGYGWGNSRDKVTAVHEATCDIFAVMRDDAVTMAIGLQDLELPALVTLEILDAAFPNAVPMHKKWDLVVAVKHFHERHAQ